MSKEYQNLAREIINKVGGEANIADVYHCQTRLRFQLADESKADKYALEATDGVVKAMSSGGVFQVVIGTHVKAVYEEVEKLLPMKTDNEQQRKSGEKKNIAGIVIDFIAGTFQPIVPALSGAGMIKALLALLFTLKVISNTSQTYYILNFFADAIFYFLPMLLAFSQAQKLKCNPILAAGIAAIMMHPNWAAMVTAGEAVNFFGVIPFTLASYTGSVIPVILVVLVQSYVERFLEKIIPKSVKLVFVPMLTFLVMGTLALSVLGPIGTIIGSYLAVFFTFLSTYASWAPSVLIGGFLPIMVMFGLHNGVAPLGVMQMAERGYDSIFGPGCVCSNISQGVACLVVSFRTKDTKTRQIALSAGITGLMGITEPALYGITLPKKYPLIAAMIGGGCGGLYAGLTQTHRFATGSSGLPAVLLYIGDDTLKFFYNIIIALVISAVVTAVLTYVLSFKFEKTSSVETDDQKTDDNNQSVQLESAGKIYSPLKGRVIPLEEIGDGIFSSGVVGQGCGIEPETGEVYAPFDGEIILVADTKHAIGIKSDDGIEVMVHVGLDTVELKGQGYEVLAKAGERVTCGQLLMRFDKEEIALKYPTVTAVLVTNSGEFKSIELLKTGAVKQMEPIMNVTQEE